MIDACGSVLLLSTRDASDPTFVDSWELPGGGINAGETEEDAAVRELCEETGLHVMAADLGPVLWRRDVYYRYRGENRLQSEAIFAIRLAIDSPPIEGGGREPFEQEDHLEYRWWSPDAIRQNGAFFYPRTLAEHVDELIAGTTVHEATERWI